MTDLSKVTSSCYCQAVKLQYSVEGDNLFVSFICRCTDDFKITSSMFGATNFALKSDTIKHLRGEDNLTKYSHKKGIATGDQMDSYFCKTCGSLLYRISSGFPGYHVLRLGAVDDTSLAEGVLKPTIEQFAKDRVSWAGPIDGIKEIRGNSLKPKGKEYDDLGYLTAGGEWDGKEVKGKKESAL